MTFRVIIEYDADAEAYSAVCPELPGCTSAGFTEAEARENIKEAILLYLAPSPLELSEGAKVLEVQVG
jgi:predicted RNase H-like HicB family nuclease